MNLETAKRAFGTDRVLLLGIIQFLVEKKLLSSLPEIESLWGYCRDLVTSFRRTRDPVLLLQLDETETELEHIFRAFKLKD